MMAGLTGLPTALRAQTNCNIALPYSTGFETDVSNQAPACWTTLSGEAYAFNFFYYAHTGNQILALNSASGEAKIATPRIPLPLNQVGVSMWYVDLALSAFGVMRVGFTTSLTGTVQWLDTITPGYDYALVELDFTSLSITDTGYLVFAYNNASGTGSGLVDDLTIMQMSTCGAVDNLHATGLSNNEATVAWSENVSLATGYWCYIADTNSRQHALDSVFVAAGTGSHTFTGLVGNRQYYVWVVSVCGAETGMEAMITFTTNPDCGEVRNLHATADYRLIGLDWDTPATGDEATGYLVAYKAMADAYWTTDTAYGTYYHIAGLQPATGYDYRVTTMCGDSTGMTVEGTAYTLGCTVTVKDSTGTHYYLPVAYSSANSYTQQLYTASELGGIDTIRSLTFFLANDYIMETTPVMVYLGNTARSQFASGSDYVPAAQLTQVYAGMVSNEGREVTVRLDTPFVRAADSSLVVAVDNNLDDFSMSTPAFVVGSGVNRSIYRSSLSDINPSAPSVGTRANFVNKIRFGTTGCALPSCNSPVVGIAAVGDDYVDVAWNAETGVAYICEVRRVGESLWTVVDSSVATGTYHFGDLEVGQSYELRVSRLCETDTLSGSTVVALPCLPVAVPFGENFEQGTLNGMFSRPCWKSGSLSTGYFTRYPTITSQTGSTNRVCLISDGYIVMPKFDLPLYQLQVRLDLVQTSASDVLVLGLLDELDDTITMLTVVDSFAFNHGGGTVDTSILYRLGQLGSAEGHLVFVAPLGGSYQYIDNIVVEEIPDCIPAEQMAVAGVTTTSAMLSWTQYEGHSVATGHVVEYGPRFFQPGTGTMQDALSNPYLLTGLNSGSDYDVYVYTLCGSDTTLPTGPVRFSTQCDAILQLPYAMDFEGIQAAEYNGQTLPTCWTGEHLGSGTVPELAMSADSAVASSGSYALLFHGPGIVALPEINASLNDLKVEFHLYRNNPGTATLIVGMVDSVEPGFAASFVPIDTVAYMDGVNETDVTIYLTEYAGTANRLALRAIGASYTNQYVDDLVVENITECIAPQHVSLVSRSTTEATIAWRMSQASRYCVEYGLTGFTPGTGTRDTVSALHATLGSLLPGTEYDVRVSSLCDEGESTPTLFSFSTLRGLPVSRYPYVCSFGDSVECNAWQLDNGGQTNRWCVGSAVYSDGDDGVALYISDSNGATHSYSRNQATHAYAYRAFAMEHTSYRIHYDWMAGGERNYDFLRVFLVPAGVNFVPGRNPSGTTTTMAYSSATPSGWLALDGGNGLSNETEWQSMDIDFEIPTPGDYYLLFYWLNDGSGGTQPPAAVDNIRIELRGCPKADSLVVEDVAATSITLAWDNHHLAQEYLVEHGPSGFTAGSGTVDTVSGNRIVVGGLNPDEEYDFYVTTVCGDGWYADSTASLLNVRTLEIATYTVTVLVNNDSYGTVEGGGIYEEGTVVTLTAIPAEGYYFVMWDDEVTDNPRQLTVEADTTLTAVFAQEVGIDESDMKPGMMKMYPNPASQKVTIECPGAKALSVVDMKGREVLHRTFNEGRATLDVSHLARGAYFVRAEGDSFCQPQKLILE